MKIAPLVALAIGPLLCGLAAFAQEPSAAAPSAQTAPPAPAPTAPAPTAPAIPTPPAETPPSNQILPTPPATPGATPGATPAATPPNSAEAAPKPLPPLFTPAAPTSTTQVALYLLLLTGLAAGGIYFLRNGFAGFKTNSKGNRKLHITETRGLGNRQFLIVAEYESRKVLLGVCPGRIDFLCNLTLPEFPDIHPEDLGIPTPQNQPSQNQARQGEEARHV